MYKIYYGTNVPQLYLALAIPTVLDGLIDSSSRRIVDCLRHKNSFAMWPLIGGMICQMSLLHQPPFHQRFMAIFWLENDYYDFNLCCKYSYTCICMYVLVCIVLICMCVFVYIHSFCVLVCIVGNNCMCVLVHIIVCCVYFVCSCMEERLELN